MDTRTPGGKAVRTSVRQVYQATSGPGGTAEGTPMNGTSHAARMASAASGANSEAIPPRGVSFPRSLGIVPLTLGSGVSATVSQICLDEPLEVAVEDRVGVGHLHTRTVVLHEPIGVENVGADLRPELDVASFSSQLLDLVVALAPGQVRQTGLEDAHGHRPVLHLGPLVLTRGADARRDVGDPHRR